MTQTIDQRARELLARHGGLPKGAISALTEALTRIEELEGAQPKDGEDGYTREPYPAEEAMDDAWSGILSAHHISPPLMMAMSIAMGDMISLINELRHYDARLSAAIGEQDREGIHTVDTPGEPQ